MGAAVHRRTESSGGIRLATQAAVSEKQLIHFQVEKGIAILASGFGRELGSYALEHYTQVKDVWVNLKD